MNSTPDDATPAAGASQNREAVEHAWQDARWAEKQGLHDRAVTAYRKLAVLCPGEPQVHVRLAELLLATGQNVAALQAAEQALALAPGDVSANATAGRALLGMGEAVRALPYLGRALSGRPDLHGLRRQLAESLLELRRPEEAIATFTAAEGQFGQVPEFVAAGAAIYRRAEAGTLAERAYRKLLELSPAREAAWVELAQLYMDFSHLGKARDVALEALRRWPDRPGLLHILALAQSSLGQVQDSVASYRRILELAPQMATSHSNLLLTLHYSTEATPAVLAEEHRRWGRLHAPPSLACRSFTNSAEPERPLRVGFISPDFKRHSVAFFFESLLDHLDRQAFELYCYSDVQAPDEVTGRIRGKANAYRTVAALPDPQVAALIKADGIDILVDLAGHAGTWRTTLLGYKPAPVQATWCGYPDTTGIEAVDYRITDWLADPAGSEAHYTETLCRLPGAFLCFRPPEQMPDIGPPPSRSGQPLTFGSFNREFKASRECYDMWCRILQAVPGSRMVMKSIAGGDPATRERQLQEFGRRGIPPERVRLLGFVAGQSNHLACYRDVDIALDTYPYHGTTTTLDALLMSVPVITLAGYNHASRVGVSLLTRVGLPEFIATTPEEYVARAVALAGQPQRLADLHASLRDRLLRSPLCDGPGFARDYGRALRGMWLRWCREQGVGLSPGQAALAAFDFRP